MEHTIFSLHPIAVPSWVMAGTIAENAHFIARQCRDMQSSQVIRLMEIGLCFFETASCLAYTDEDLPASLADLPLSWHVHLPSDLPWHEGGAAVARIAVSLMGKVAFLGTRRAVLHPPVGYADGGAALLRDFMAVWCGAESRGGACRVASDIHLENICGHDVVALWPTIEELGCKLCVDTGHLFAYGQSVLKALLLEDETALHAVGMVHLCATNPSGGHASLTALSPSEQAYVAELCRAVPQNTVLMLELFKWAQIEESLPLLCSWLEENMH